MNSKKLLAIASVFVCVFAFTVCVSYSDSSDAAESVVKAGEPEYGGFSDMDKGHFNVFVKNNTAAPITVKVVVYDAADNEAMDTTVQEIPADAESHKVSMSFKFSHSGDKHVFYTVYNEDGSYTYFSEGNFDLSVKHSMWKNTGTYVIIAVVVIAIIVAGYFIMRARANKRAAGAPTKTFTELAEERKAKKIGKVAKKEMYDASASKKKRE